jgi:hypothetical protein
VLLAPRWPLWASRTSSPGAPITDKDQAAETNALGTLQTRLTHDRTKWLTITGDPILLQTDLSGNYRAERRAKLLRAHGIRDSA